MEEMFEKIVTIITDVIGAETTNTTQLKRIGQQLFAPGFFLGVYPAKQKPQQTGNRGFYIVNSALICFIRQGVILGARF